MAGFSDNFILTFFELRLAHNANKLFLIVVEIDFVFGIHDTVLLNCRHNRVLRGKQVSRDRIIERRHVAHVLDSAC